ncbi:trypsin-like peptidase domain-containing protein [Bradyrhizobium sp. 61]|uniref:trypsin-like serine peptidase n=1 Tax=Bradyrhizobium sp. 61 TaxID=2782679 RepID=UPI001FF777D1|nr:serine protease [Bradyrhizobium sp. 61]MCK1280106.1 trypsin-like peptidase domain-containing protein [Bradyrhizobium sp. 61]
MAGADGHAPVDIGRYMEIMRSGNPVPSMDASESSEGRTESAGRPLDLSPGAIERRVSVASEQLHFAVSEHLDDSKELHGFVDEIVGDGAEALKALSQNDAKKLATQPGLLASLEAIVRTDGSRPSFMIRNGEVDLTTSPVGAWKGDIETSRDLLVKGLQCVGRIDVPGSEQGFEGTGFLIQKNLVMTNRHVLQVIAEKDGANHWKIKNGCSIDFGHEFRGTKQYPNRALKSVAFAASDEIDLDAPVNHSNLDLVLIELSDPATAADNPPVPLGVDIAADWADLGQTIYTVGYPGRPILGANPTTLLEQLFKSTYGCKRLAPGVVVKSKVNVRPWTVTHDATTLSGNSGSVILVVGREQISAAIHYGGRTAEPRENWGHILGLTFDGVDATSGKSLRDCLNAFDVVFVDRIG